MTVYRKNPDLPLLYQDGKWWTEFGNLDGWIHLGYVKTPTNKRETFWYHVYHGKLCGYSWISVLKFAWKNRRSFNDA